MKKSFNFLVFFSIIFSLNLFTFEKVNKLTFENENLNQLNSKEEGDIYFQSPANGESNTFGKLQPDGDFYMWGSNGDGQAGVGQPTFITQESDAPLIYSNSEGWISIGNDSELDNFSGIKNVTLGTHISTALMNNGSVYSWGSNEDGDFGNGSISGAYSSDKRLIYKANPSLEDTNWEDTIDETGFVISPSDNDPLYSPSIGYHGRAVNINYLNGINIKFEDGAIFSTSLNYDRNYYLQLNPIFDVDERSFSILNTTQEDGEISTIDFEINGLFSFYDARDLDLKINMINDFNNINETYTLDFLGYDNSNYENKNYRLETNTDTNGALLTDTEYEITSVSFYEKGTDNLIDKEKFVLNEDQFDLTEGFHFKTGFKLASVNNVSVDNVAETSLTLTVEFNALNDTDPKNIELYSKLKIKGDEQTIKLNYNDEPTEINSTTYQYDVFGLKSESTYNDLIIYSSTGDLLTDRSVIYENNDFNFTTEAIATSAVAIYGVVLMILILIIILSAYLSYYLFYYRRRILKYERLKKHLYDLSVEDLND